MIFFDRPKNIVDELFSKHPSLSYEQINELRKYVRRADELKEQMEREDAFIEKYKGGPVIFEHLNGMISFSHESWITELASMMAPIRFKKRSKPDYLYVSEKDLSKFKPIEISTYNFSAFRGPPGERVAHYIEEPT